jgi:hypothetical protein
MASTDTQEENSAGEDNIGNNDANSDEPLALPLD